MSPRARNKKRVLWLRDSFGLALAPFLAATFTETIEIHWSEALRSHGKQLVELVDSWDPDYVIVTVVERDALSGALAQYPVGDRN